MNRPVQLGEWVKYGDEICQVLDIYTQGGKWVYYIYNHADGKSHDVIGGMTLARPRVELRNGKVWKIHYPNPYAKWGRAKFDEAFPCDFLLIVYIGDHFDPGIRLYSKRSNAIRGLIRLSMSTGMSFEVEG